MATVVFALIGAALLIIAIVLALLGSFAFIAIAAVGCFFIAAALVSRASRSPAQGAAAVISVAGIALVVFGLVATPLFYLGWACLGAGLIGLAASMVALRREPQDAALGAASPAPGRRRALLILAPIVVLASLAFWAYGPFSDPPPESRVQAYLEATARGDEASALGIWQSDSPNPPPTCCAPLADLEARRVSLTRELAAAGAGQPFRIEFIEWWRTCCEPGIISDPRNAGRARIFVSTSDRAGAKHELVFEVMTKDGAYWGDAAGYPRHDWTLREAYRRGEQSLRRPAIVPLSREDAIRSSRSLAPVPENATIEARRVSLADLRAVLGAQDFLPPADPARFVWVVTATGEMGGGPPKAAWSVVVLDADEHIVLGTRFGEPNARPPYFDTFRTPAPGDYLPPPLNRLEVKVIDALAQLGVTGQRAQLPYQDASIWAQLVTGSQLFINAGPTGTRGGDFAVVDERQLAGLRVQRVQYASDPPLRHRFECSADTYEVRGAVPLGFSDMNAFVTGFIRALGCAA